MLGSVDATGRGPIGLQISKQHPCERGRNIKEPIFLSYPRWLYAQMAVEGNIEVLLVEVMTDWE